MHILFALDSTFPRIKMLCTGWRMKKSSCVKSGDLGGQPIIDPTSSFRELGIKKITHISFKLG